MTDLFWKTFVTLENKEQDQAWVSSIHAAYTQEWGVKRKRQAGNIKSVQMGN